MVEVDYICIKVPKHNTLAFIFVVYLSHELARKEECIENLTKALENLDQRYGMNSKKILVGDFNRDLSKLPNKETPADPTEKKLRILLHKFTYDDSMLYKGYTRHEEKLLAGKLQVEESRIECLGEPQTPAIGNN